MRSAAPAMRATIGLNCRPEVEFTPDYHEKVIQGETLMNERLLLGLTSLTEGESR